MGTHKGLVLPHIDKAANKYPHTVMEFDESVYFDFINGVYQNSLSWYNHKAWHGVKRLNGQTCLQFVKRTVETYLHYQHENKAVVSAQVNKSSGFPNGLSY